MEKFEAQEYRDQLAKDLKDIPEHSERKKALESEKYFFRRKKAEALHNPDKKLSEIERGFEGHEMVHITIGEKTKNELIKEMEQKQISITEEAKSLIESSDFTSSNQKKELVLVVLKSIHYALGSRNNRELSIQEIYKDAQAHGLELCPPEVGPALILKYPEGFGGGGGGLAIGMKSISVDSAGGRNRGGDCIFCLNHFEKKELSAEHFDGRWDERNDIVFCLPQK